MFPYLTALECQECAARTSAKINLYNNAWHSSELACVLGNNSAEAAEKVLRIVESVSVMRRVLFIDLQGSDRSFGERTCAEVPRNILHVDLDLAGFDPSAPEKFLAEIEETIVGTGVRVCAIDSLFYLCEWSGKSAAARFFITKLREMSRRLDVAILIGANARRRISRNTVPTAEYLPKGTAPYVDAIIPRENDESVENGQSVENEAGTLHDASPATALRSEMAVLPEPTVTFQPPVLRSKPRRKRHRR